MESLQDILGRYGPAEPPEIAAIKKYIADQFQAPASVSVRGENIIITVHSAALANTLRFHVTKIQAFSETTKRLILRIG